jgi:hypothetical protein
MNANELAFHSLIVRLNGSGFCEAATMLRQQQAEIEALKVALNLGYEETMSYIKQNNLTGSENNHWIVLARKALGK